VPPADRDLHRPAYVYTHGMYKRIKRVGCIIIHVRTTYTYRHTYMVIIKFGVCCMQIYIYGINI
jgi:DUF1365 family protein